MFFGFDQGAVKIPGYTMDHHLEDIQTLNDRAFRGEFEITAVSAHAYAYLTDRYWVLNCGASVGRGYGPILVQQKNSGKKSPFQIAIPGQWTTAALVLNLWLAENNLKAETRIMPFDEILPAVERGEIDSGLLIHEGQLTFGDHGLEKVWDAGEWWQKKTGLPLPLGLDVVRADLGEPLARQISQALRDSILYAQAHPEEALEYALRYGRGLDKKLGKRFVAMYVNKDTLEQGADVQQGLQKLYDEAFRLGFLPSKPIVRFI
ncbi:MAG: MqnA/MqnD/SBP family protein [Elusimicrobiota bacterium]|jgi:1,4-dihydroxy-6-naphthoate synthase